MRREDRMYTIQIIVEGPVVLRKGGGGMAKEQTCTCG